MYSRQSKGEASENTDLRNHMTRHEDIACTRCGCICDDLAITVENDRVVKADRACALAESWFLEQGAHHPPPATLNGRSVKFETGINRAAEILFAARYPLVYGLSRSSTDGQRAAVRLADRIGAVIDTTASRCHAPSIMAIQQVGESTCSLGEAKNRCDLVVFWGCDPVNSHPRHGERYSLDPPGLFLPNGRKDRHVIVVDHKRTDSVELADRFVRVKKGRDFEMIWTLRRLLRNPESSSSNMAGIDDQLRQLADRLRSCRSGIVYFGLGLAQAKSGHSTVEALLRLVADLNAHTRFYARRMRIPGDVTGADNVLCWQTGFPFAVNLTRGYPRYNPDEYTANEILERGEADACLLVGGEAEEGLSKGAVAQLKRIPTVVLDYPNAVCSFEPTVRFTTAVYGVHASGTAYRMDEVPIPLEAFLPTDYAGDDEVLQAILAQGESDAGNSSLQRPNNQRKNSATARC